MLILRRFASFLLAGSLSLGCASSSVRPEPQADSGAEPLGRTVPGRKQVIQAILPSNVRVAVVEEGRPIRAASGVVIASTPEAGAEGAPVGRPTSWVMTNAHVAVNVLHGEGRILEVWVGPEGEEEKHVARLVALGDVPDTDLAVLEVPGLASRPVELATDDIEVGEDVVAVGAPYGKGISVSTGIVSQVRRQDGSDWSLKTDAPIGYGASGGGIFRVSDGRLLAVVEGYRTAKVSFPVEERSYSFDIPMPGETFAAPVGKIRAFLQEEGLTHLVTGGATVAAKE